jgi:hypothetical protein
MSQIKVWISVLGVWALGAGAAGGRDTPDLKLRGLDETVPAGSVVQMKFRTTEGTPISGGRGWIRSNAAVFSGLVGIAIFARNGEAAGAAVVDGTDAALTYVTTQPFTDEYPVVTVALRLRQDLAPGTSTQFGLDPSSLWNVNGTFVRARVDPGTVTVGGSVAIADVIPGEGWFPAGTEVSVRGVGFNSLSRLRVDDVAVTSVRYVSPTEMRFTLGEAGNLTAARLRVDNPDLSRITYYSYMRGVPAETSGRTLLSRVHPIFSGTTRSVSTIGPIPVVGAQYAALALQNPDLTAADVTIGLYAADGTFLYSSTRSLPNGTRLTLELSELLDGVVPPPGGFVQVTSSLPIEAFGMLCDEGTWTVTPRLALEAF